MGYIGKVILLLLSFFIFAILQINSSALSNILYGIGTNKFIGNRENRLGQYGFQHPPENPSSGYYYLPQQGYSGYPGPSHFPYQSDSNWSFVQFLDVIMNGIRIILDISTLNDDQESNSEYSDSNYGYDNGESDDPSTSEYY